MRNFDFVLWAGARRVGLQFVAAALTALTPCAAWAWHSPTSGTHFFKPPDDDTSLGMLREVFGNLVDLARGNASAADLAANNTVMGAGSAIFCTAVMTLGLLFVAWTTITKVLHTAHDGEFLGKQMNNKFIPLRIIGGSAILLPIGGGFCVIQILVMWLAVQGVGVADATWDAMINKIDQTGMVVRPNIPSARPLAAQILRSEVCMAAMNKSFQEQNRPERIVLNVTPYSISGNGTHEFRYSWDATGGLMDGQGICGELSWKRSEQQGLLDSILTMLGADMDKTLSTAHTAATSRMIMALRPVAADIVAGGKPTAGPIESAANTYENALQLAARQAVNAGGDKASGAFVGNAKKGGWVGAGSYYNHIIEISDDVQKSINALPEPRAISITNQMAATELNGYNDAMAVTEEFLKMRSQSAEQQVDADVMPSSTVAIDCIRGSVGGVSQWGGLNKCLNEMQLRMLKISIGAISDGHTSHMMQVKKLGNVTLAMSDLIIATIFGVSGVANSFDATVGGEVLSGGLFNIGEAIKSVGSIFTSAAIMLWFAGAVMSFYMPLIPFISWATGIIKWVVSVFQALIAAPIFAAAHIHPDGDEFVGRAGPGYFILLSMFLRPVLMLFGFMAAIAVAQPISHFVNSQFVLVVQGSMKDSMDGMLGAYLIYLIIYVVLMTIVLHAVFALINWVPDNALSVIGHAAGVHGIADHEGKEAGGVIMSTTRQASHAASSGISQTRGGRPDMSASGNSGASSADLSPGNRVSDATTEAKE